MNRLINLNCARRLSSIGSMKPFIGALVLLFTVSAHSLIAVAQQGAATDELAALAKQFIELLAREDFANAVKNFDATMTKLIPEANLRELWTTLKAQAGAYKKPLATRTEKVSNYDVIVVTCEFEKMPIDVKIVFDNQKRISGLFYLPVEKPKAFPPPDYVNRDSFIEKEVTVGTGEWPLPATLTLPKGDGPFAAVVLVHGSGPHDGRD
jgi:uncharacterized protein